VINNEDQIGVMMLGGILLVSLIIVLYSYYLGLQAGIKQKRKNSAINQGHYNRMHRKDTLKGVNDVPNNYRNPLQEANNESLLSLINKDISKEGFIAKKGK
jgi:hypothetical protein